MRIVKRNIMGLLLSLVLIVSCSINVMAADVVQNMEFQQICLDGMGENDQVVYEGIYNCKNSPLMRSPIISAASLRVTPRSNEIYIEITTSCNFTATKVGVSDVLVQEKVWYGWKTIASGSDYELNSTSFSGSTHCTTAQKGKTYRVLCTHYAIESNGTKHTVANQSEEFVYN